MLAGNESRADLHADFADVAAAGQQRLAGLFSREIADHVQQNRCDTIGREYFLIFIGHDAVGELARGGRRDGPHADAVLQAFLRQ